MTTCGGIHCAGCGGGAASPVLILAALEGFTWLAAHAVEVLATSATCGILAFAAVVVLMRIGDRRDARQAAAPPLLRVRAEAIPLPARAAPQVSRGTVPAIENHYHGPQFIINGETGQDVAARLIRQALAAPEHQEVRP